MLIHSATFNIDEPFYVCYCFYGFNNEKVRLEFMLSKCCDTVCASFPDNNSNDWIVITIKPSHFLDEMALW